MRRGDGRGNEIWLKMVQFLDFLFSFSFLLMYGAAESNGRGVFIYASGYALFIGLLCYTSWPIYLEALMARVRYARTRDYSHS